MLPPGRRRGQDRQPRCGLRRGDVRGRQCGRHTADATRVEGDGQPRARVGGVHREKTGGGHQSAQRHRQPGGAASPRPGATRLARPRPGPLHLYVCTEALAAAPPSDAGAGSCAAESRGGGGGNGTTPRRGRACVCARAVVVESTGILPAPVLVREALKHMIAKIRGVRAGLERLLNPPADDATET